MSGPDFHGETPFSVSPVSHHVFNFTTTSCTDTGITPHLTDNCGERSSHKATRPAQRWHWHPTRAVSYRCQLGCSYWMSPAS